MLFSSYFLSQGEVGLIFDSEAVLSESGRSDRHESDASHWPDDDGVMPGLIRFWLTASPDRRGWKNKRPQVKPKS